MGVGRRPWFSVFGAKKADHRGHDAEAEARQPRKDREQERKPRHQRDGREAEMEPRRSPGIPPSAEDRMHWVGEPDIDRKATEFIEREHQRRMVPEQNSGGLLVPSSDSK